MNYVARFIGDDSVPLRCFNKDISVVKSMISEEERSYRRRLVYNAMPDGVSETTVQKSLTVLEREFSDVSEIKYSDFVQRLQRNLDRAELNIGTLLGRIMTLKDKPATELRPEPNSAALRSAVAEALPLDGRLKVFNTMLATIADDLARRGADKVADFRTYWIENASSQGFTDECETSLVAWAQNPGAVPRVGGTNKELAKLVNAAFVWLCNKFGPVEGDKFLHRAVAAAERLPESFDCSPRVFL